MIKYWTGNKRKFHPDYCKAINVHPSVATRKAKNPWVLSEKDQCRIEAYLECVLIPISYKNDFDLSAIFQQSGHIKGTGHFHIFTTLMPLILSVAKFHNAYKAFWRMLSLDITSLLAPEFVDSELEDLYNKLCETLAIREGLFPDSEGLMVFHQLADIPFHIRQFGPMRGWWTLYGERALCTLKKVCPTKGSQADKTAILRWVDVENNRTTESYGFDINNLHDFCSYSDQKKRYQTELNNPKYINITEIEGKNYIEYDGNSFYSWDTQ